ncbi:MAG: hypothetical protein ACLPX9_12560 [Rhodomicrobium sp.]
MNKSRTVELIREGKYLAEVEVELLEDETAWSPYLTLEGVEKLDAVRLALRAGDVKAATQQAKVYEMVPVGV